MRPESSLPRISIGVYPVINILTMMSHLLDLEDYPGITESLLQIAERLSSEQQDRHRLVFQGLGIEALAVAVPISDQTGFVQYMHTLERMEPFALRDRLLTAILHSAHLRVHVDSTKRPSADPDRLLADAAAFLAFVETEGKEPGDEALFAEIHTLLNQPEQLQSLVTDHLRTLWRDLLLVEWERTRPLLEEVVAALHQADFGDLAAPIDLLEFVSGRSLREVFDLDALLRFQHIALIPSRHTGPYVSWFGDDDIFYFVFGARRPPSSGTALLDQPELLNRLAALTDSVRLDILLAIRRHEELSTQQIMDIFNLNKSAASRHLRLLRASELVHERREKDNKGKLYSINTACITAVSATLNALLGAEQQAVSDEGTAIS